MPPGNLPPRAPIPRAVQAWRPLAASALLAACLLVHPAAGAPAAPHPALGINLAGPVDWNTELPFVDVFRLSREWISQKEGEAWGKGPALDLDAHGWVNRLQPGCWAETPLCTFEGGHMPSGEWTVLWEGDGAVELSRGEVTRSAPGRLVVRLDAQGGGFFLRLRRTNPANPVRRLRVLKPGIDPAAADRNPWDPAFLARWRGVACLRFMDLQAINDSKQRQPADRPTPDDATWTRSGLPPEVLCDLANRLETDAWFCLPHLATDDYVREYATLVKRELKPGRRAWIEYSNEVWNGQFAQNRHAAAEGLRLKLADKPWEAAWHYTARRSVEIFKIWEHVFGGRERLVRVLASQAANSYVAGQILGWEGAASRADALAVAPYLTLVVPQEGPSTTSKEVSTWTVDRLLNLVETNKLPECAQWMAANRKVADQYGLRLVAYEAGQHLVGVGGAENDEALTRLFLAANAHPRMGAIYEQYLASWEANGGDLLCHFSSVSAWTKWGSWGLLQYADDDPRQAPKFLATMRWARKLGQSVTAP